MKKTLFVKLFIFCMPFMTSISGYAQIFGPSTYEDCVLQGLKEAKTELSVSVLMGICSSKFGKKEKPKDRKQDTAASCFLYWDGLSTSKLESPPKDWRKNYSAFSISKYNIEFAIIYVPKSFTNNKEAENEMWQMAHTWCK